MTKPTECTHGNYIKDGPGSPWLCTGCATPKPPGVELSGIKYHKYPQYGKDSEPTEPPVVTKPTEHTPGPWKTCGLQVTTNNHVLGSVEIAHCGKEILSGVFEPETCLANAALIARAPDMQDLIDRQAEALVKIVQDSDKMFGEADAKLNARALTITAQRTEIDGYKEAIKELQELHRGVTEKACEDQAEIDRLRALRQAQDEHVVLLMGALIAAGLHVTTFVETPELGSVHDLITDAIDEASDRAAKIADIYSELAALKPESETNDE